MRIPSYLHIITLLLSFNLASAQNFVTIIYALNTRGEIYANVNGAWIKGPALPQIDTLSKGSIQLKQGISARTIHTIAAGPSVTKSDGTQQGQLYAIDAAHALWSMPEVSVAKPFGNNQWQSINSPQLANIAVGKEQLMGFLYKSVSFIWDKRPLATKGVFDANWTIDTNIDTTFIAMSPDVPATAFHIGFRYRFLPSERMYNKPFYAQLGKTGWIEIGFKFTKIYAGVEGSCIGINQAGQMYANQQVFDPQSTWIELLPPQLTSITSIETPNDAYQWNLTLDQGTLAFGLTTDGAGQIINEIMMNATLTCLNKKDPAKRIFKNMLWRRTEISTTNRFGSGWELVWLNSEAEAPGLITALTIGSFDQTEAIKQAKREAVEAAKAKKAEQDKLLRKAEKAERDKAKQAELRKAKKKQEKQSKTAEQRARQMGPKTR